MHIYIFGLQEFIQLPDLMWNANIPLWNSMSRDAPKQAEKIYLLKCHDIFQAFPNASLVNFLMTTNRTNEGRRCHIWKYLNILS